MSSAGDKAQIINVLEFPPKAFYKILVRDDSLYGTTIFLFFEVANSANFDITKPKKLKDLLIEHPSLSLSPDAPVFPIFSLPARSTKFITENFSVPRPYLYSSILPSTYSLYLKSIEIIV